MRKEERDKINTDRGKREFGEETKIGATLKQRTEKDIERNTAFNFFNILRANFLYKSAFL